MASEDLYSLFHVFLNELFDLNTSRTDMLLDSLHNDTALVSTDKCHSHLLNCHLTVDSG